MNEQRMQFAIGVVTLVGGFALAAIIIWFGEFRFVITPRKTYTLQFIFAPGVEERVPVRRSGIRIGEVQQVEYDDAASRVVVTIVLEGEHALREGDEVAVRRPFPLGDAYLEVQTKPEMRGQPDRPLIPPGSMLEGRSPLDTGQTLQSAAEVVPNANETLLQIRTASQQWTQVGERVTKLLDANERRINLVLEETQDAVERLAVALEAVNNVLDAETQENTRVAVKNFRQASEKLTPTVESAQKALERINTSVEKFDEIATNLQKATKPLAERSESTLKNIDESSAKLNVLLDDMQALTRQLRDRDGTLQRLMRDPSLYQNADEAVAVLLESLRDLEQIMGDLKVFSDKIARHPGELGVQGIFTKDKGLKTVEPGTMPQRPRLLRP